MIVGQGNTAAQISGTGESLKWSEQQVAIHGHFATGDGHLVVRARAGCGKTSTLIGGIGVADGARRILMTAYNKRIADELGRRLTRGEAKTFHSLGLRYCHRGWPGLQIDSHHERANACVLKVMGEQAPDAMKMLVGKLAGYGKEIVPMAQSGADLVDLAYDFDCVPDLRWREEFDVEDIATAAHAVMVLAAEWNTGTVDFSDMIYLPVRNGWLRPEFDLVCIDELQDTATTQMLLATGVAGGRLVGAGDDMQALYSFRGADAESIDRLKAEWLAPELPLTITYRCPRLIVEYARQFCPDFEAAPTAPDGLIRSIAQVSLVGQAEAGDVILSRTNAPLVGVCLSLLTAGKRARIEGRDIGQGLKSLALKLSKDGDALDVLLDALDVHEEKEQARAIKTMSRSAISRLARIQDQCRMLHALAVGLNSVSALLARISELFADMGPRQIVCSTIHKFKGLENDRVFLLRGTLYPGGPDRYRSDPGALKDEQRCEYVGVTRARNELVWVD